ncbi:hypothetical protein [Halalkalicoccus jeotgali]|uniref:Uncharacterized protein n=1 Tax=Halalkalicoccus jeotgali (strain DSM 18796 / CECT 7217 / JCM 14584 / KCTC 4019 / B3) TaxID=795797 RepID=D8J9M6_HALJB|nr:hypothetical protein [Halalkalicoccus jeotgali]ADJ14438.1 hypothetical protein HacjB3_05235 [Halalkalicoccus jeotgali B3]ELY40154.1 hypothetical protein C497_03620 [Halalkalicoccus jeotgali B3]
MPISTESDTWKEADVGISDKTGILEFLESNPDKAFTTPELCDAIEDTRWGEVIEELQKPGQTDKLVEIHESDEWDRMMMLQREYNIHLDDLMASGDVECRVIPSGEDDNPSEEDASYYTIA